MRVVICQDQKEAADLVTEQILAALSHKPDLVLGLATGSTPLAVYARLIRAHQGGVDFSHMRTFNLDEYVGLAADHAQSYRHFMQKHLFEGIGMPAQNVHFPPTDGAGLNAQCEDFEQKIAHVGGIDIQLLGIGSNGHVGFNEPTSSLASRTRLKTLTEKTLSDNARFYPADEQQPRVAATMGIGTILDARRVFIQAFGPHKAKAVHAAIEGPISSFWPASALQHHPHVNFYLDEASSGALTMRDYYKQVQDAEQQMQDRGLL